MILELLLTSYPLKRIATIILLGTLLFNWYGYQLLNAWLETRATGQLEKKLDDSNYEESELISLKVPAIHLTYYNNSAQFERINGEIEISGIQYNYVKRRLYNDSIEMLCIPNHGAMHLKKLTNDFFKLTNDLQNQGQQKKNSSHSSKSFTGDYCTIHDLLKMENLFYNSQKITFYYTVELLSTPSSTDEHPPDAIC